MNTLKLGYTEKWFDYNFLNEETLLSQITEFEKGDEQSTEHYRYASFQNWLEAKESLTNEEIENYIELALNDEDERMGGSAIKALFVSSKISDKQFDLLKVKLPQFGEWTEKLISREVLIRRLKSEELSEDLFNLCYKYKTDFNDNRLLIGIIKKTDNYEYLSMFENMEVGKKMKTLASNKLSKLVKAN